MDMTAEGNRHAVAMVGIVAHDLRGPLSVINAYAELLLKRRMLVDPDAGYVEQIAKAAQFMTALTEDMLWFSAIETGRLHLNRQPVDLGDLAEAAAAMARLGAEIKDIRIHVERPAAPVVAQVDPLKIAQLLNNLIGNAVKFSTAGHLVRIRAETLGGRARLTVADQGCGIPPGRLARLFQPFGGGTSGTSGEPSTGLGLYICSRVAEAHDGRIEVESQVGEGSRFIVTLPLGTPPSPSTAAAS
jgi:signal transduction histidine kinase